MEQYIQLEREYAKWAKKKYAVAVNTGTAALHLSLLALGIKKGDEVIVPDFAFASVAFAVTYCGATPVFVDVDENYNLDVELVADKVNPNTKAIIIVHTYGRKANTAALKRFQLPIIEDLCEAQGILPEDDTIAVYSLYRNKILPAEEGGIILTDNEEMFIAMQSMKNMSNDGKYFHKTLGFNYRMTNSQASLGLKSFYDQDEIFRQRWEILNNYLIAFGGNQPDVPWVFDMLSDNVEEILEKIPESRPFFKPQSTFPIYNQTPEQRSLDISKRGFVIGLNPSYDHDAIIRKLTQIVMTHNTTITSEA